MKRRPKIVFVWNYLNWGGAQIYFLAVIKSACENWDITVLLPEGSSAEFLGFLDGLNVTYEFLDHHIESGSADTVYEKLCRQFRRFRSEAEIFRRLYRCDHRQTVVHIECSPWQSWQLYLALSFIGANVFATLHNSLKDGGSFRRLLWKTRLKFISLLPRFHIFTSNRDTKERFKGWFLDRFHRTIRVTYTCVDPVQIKAAGRSDRNEIRARFGLDPADLIVLTVGQFIDRKGRWVLLDAARSSIANDPRLRFVWLMPSKIDDWDAERVAEYDLGEKFRPILSADVGKDRIEILEFFRIADFFVLPSFVEGLPIALLEAMALGIPAISTEVYAIPEAVKHGENGILVSAGDARELAARILETAADSQLRSRLSRSGREFVLKNFDERDAARTILRSYKRALKHG